MNTYYRPHRAIMLRMLEGGRMNRRMVRVVTARGLALYATLAFFMGMAIGRCW